MAVGALICRLFCKFATTNIIEQLVNLLAVTFFHIRSATVTTIILAAAVATSTRYAQVNALQCELLSAAFGLGKYPRPHSLVLVVAVAVALVTRVSARAGARAVLLFELGIKALALKRFWALMILRGGGVTGLIQHFANPRQYVLFARKVMGKPLCSNFSSHHFHSSHRRHIRSHNCCIDTSTDQGGDRVT